MTSIWRPISSKDEPKTHLKRWRVFSVPLEGGEPTIHFIGDASHEGRVSSPIVSYNKYNRQGISSSGRIYQLDGESGHDMTALAVWHKWCSMFSVDNPTDVTELY